MQRFVSFQARRASIRWRVSGAHPSMALTGSDQRSSDLKAEFQQPPVDCFASSNSSSATYILFQSQRIRSHLQYKYVRVGWEQNTLYIVVKISRIFDVWGYFTKNFFYCCFREDGEFWCFTRAIEICRANIVSVTEVFPTILLLEWKCFQSFILLFFFVKFYRVYWQTVILFWVLKISQTRQRILVYGVFPPPLYVTLTFQLGKKNNKKGFTGRWALVCPLLL